MPDGPRRKFERRRRGIRGLIALTVLVVMVDLAAGVLTAVADHRSNRARSEVTAGLGYETNTNALLQAMFAADTAVRGYLLTGERSYFTPLRSEVSGAPAIYKAIRTGSRGDPVLRRDFSRLVVLLKARTNDLVRTFELAQKGLAHGGDQRFEDRQGQQADGGDQDVDPGDEQALHQAGRPSEGVLARQSGVGQPRERRRVHRLWRAARGDGRPDPHLHTDRGRQARVATGAARG